MPEIITIAESGLRTEYRDNQAVRLSVGSRTTRHRQI